jgi:hypothetical protein
MEVKVKTMPWNLTRVGNESKQTDRFLMQIGSIIKQSNRCFGNWLGLQLAKIGNDQAHEEHHFRHSKNLFPPSYLTTTTTSSSFSAI